MPFPCFIWEKPLNIKLTFAHSNLPGMPSFPLHTRCLHPQESFTIPRHSPASHKSHHHSEPLQILLQKQHVIQQDKGFQDMPSNPACQVSNITHFPSPNPSLPQIADWHTAAVIQESFFIFKRHKGEQKADIRT